PHLRRHHRLDRARAPDDRPPVPQRPAKPGHVHGRVLRAVAVGPDGDRRPDLGPAAGVAGSPDQAGRGGGTMSAEAGRPAADGHYVNQAPWNPEEEAPLSPALEAWYMASQWKIIWWKLKRHRLAVISGGVLAVFYLSILVSEFLAPYALDTRHTSHIYAPPQRVHLFRDGEFVGPFVHGYSFKLNLETM